MNKFALEIKWGVIFSISQLLWMLLEKIVGLHDVYISHHATYTNFFAFVAFALYYLALWEKRKLSPSGVIKWLDGFKFGLMISVVVTVLSPLGQVFTHYVITPDYFANVSAEAVRQNIMTAQAASDYFNLKSYLFQSAVGALIMGLVTSAIMSLIVVNIKKDIDVSSK